MNKMDEYLSFNINNNGSGMYTSLGDGFSDNNGRYTSYSPNSICPYHGGNGWDTLSEIFYDAGVFEEIRNQIQFYK